MLDGIVFALFLGLDLAIVVFLLFVGLFYFGHNFLDIREYYAVVDDFDLFLCLFTLLFLFFVFVQPFLLRLVELLQEQNGLLGWRIAFVHYFPR